MDSKKLMLIGGTAVVAFIAGYLIADSNKKAAAKTAAFANASGKNPFRKKAFANFIRAKRAQA